MKEYQSFEKKYLGEDKPLGKFGKEAGIMGGGMIIGLYTLPTRIRKSLNSQTRLQREKYEGSLSKILGAATGFVAGACMDIYLTQNALHEFSRENYIPAATLGLFNFASLFFELGRFDKSKRGE